MITDSLLSVVVPARNAAEQLALFLPKITEFLTRNFLNFELIIVDDASRDNTAQLVKDAVATQKNIRLLRLARHYSNGTAIAAGLQHAIGDYTVVMNLHDPHDAILELLARCTAGADIAFATHADDVQTPLTRRILPALQQLSRLDFDPQASNFCVMHRRAMNSLLTLKDRMQNIAVMAAFLGMRADYVNILAQRSERTDMPVWWHWLHLTEAVMAYSRWPLWWLGATVMVLSAGGFFIAVISWILHGLFHFGSFMAMLGMLILFLTNGTLFIMASVVGRILGETKRQPLYHVMEDVSSRSVTIENIVRAV